MAVSPVADPRAGLPRRVARAGPVAWLLAGCGLALAALFISTSAHRWPTATAVAGVLSIVLAVRTAQAGVYVEGAALRCITWCVTHRVPLAQITRIRPAGTGLPGAARHLAVLAVERGPRRAVVLGALVGPASGVARVAARLDALRAAASPVPLAADG
jgi:hypothetical protein